jgi:ABC-type transport system involved in multi-copper enzyme maturation permease subunit
VTSLPPPFLRGLLSIARFEARRRLRAPSTRIYGLVFGGLGLLVMLTIAGFFTRLSVGNDRVAANAPSSLAGYIYLLGMLALPMVAAVAGQAVHQDVAYRCEALFFTAPLRASSYLLGRWLAAVVVSSVVLIAVPLGLWLGTVCPGVDPVRIQPNHLANYAQPYLTLLLPNVLLFSAVFVALAAISRGMAWVHAGGVVLLVGYIIGNSLRQEFDASTVAALLDPFGGTAISRLTRYWSPEERNTRMIPLTGLFLANRALWLAVGAAVLGTVVARFRFSRRSERAREPSSSAPEAAPSSGPIPRATTAPARGLAALPLALRLGWLWFRGTVSRASFIVLLLAGVMTLVAIGRTAGQIYGTGLYPVTSFMVEIVAGGMGLFAWVLIVVCTGDLAWREREEGLDQIMDALPVPDWVPLVGKLAALVLIQALMAAIAVLCGMAMQATKGYFHFEPMLYLEALGGLWWWNLCLGAALALAVQGLVGNKYVAWFALALYLLGRNWLGTLGLEHPLWRYGLEVPRHSDLNGFSGFLAPQVWHGLYSTAWAALLLVLAALCWPRGVERGWRARWRRIRARWRRPAIAALASASLAVVVTAAVIHLATGATVPFRSTYEGQVLAAEYERRYAATAAEPQPRIAAVTAAIDLWPSERRMRAHGAYRLVNRTGQPIPSVIVDLPESAEIARLVVDGVSLPSESDRPRSFIRYQLARPLAPGAETTLEFDLAYRVRGFDRDPQLVANGCFITNDRLPHLGYQRSSQLSDDAARRKLGLPVRTGLADVDDVAARANPFVSSDADWITLDLTLGTEAGQTVLGPGELQGRWESGDRAYARFTAAKVLDFFSVLSARYVVDRARWGDVDIEIYHHQDHSWDIPRMLDGARASLAFCSERFGSYPYRTLRIAEFPGYSAYAQSFPATIPFSEAIGFVARVDPASPTDIDYPFFVTAHEIAHQWWGHQLVGGNVQGCEVLSETMAQYSALMVMQREYGERRMRRFLRYDLDKYLGGRSQERTTERTLARAEYQQYLVYDKGSVAMYELQDRVGEDVVERALGGYIDAARFQPPPYTNTSELLARLRAAMPAQRALIDDLFTRIILYDDRAISAWCRRRDDGRYDLTMTVSARKLLADERGVEREQPLDEELDVGALDERGDLIARERRRLPSGESTVTMIVPKLPAKAGIDPLGILIDRVPEDNVVPVERR